MRPCRHSRHGGHPRRRRRNQRCLRFVPRRPIVPAAAATAAAAATTAVMHSPAGLHHVFVYILRPDHLKPTVFIAEASPIIAVARVVRGEA